MSLTILAAADDKWGIGYQGGLPWQVPEDLRWFKRRTMGKTVIMGRNTVDTLPSKLPGRRILTMSRHPVGPEETDLVNIVGNLCALEDEVIVAGGGQVYAALLPFCRRAEITRVKGEYECDTRMVNLSEHGWTLESVYPLSEIADIEQWTRITS